MRLIILAAGQGYKLGNYNKILLKSPRTNSTIMDSYLEIFKGADVTVVVGYKAINIMHQYPNLRYIYNPDWSITKDSYSLGLALDEEPCYVIHSDMFLSRNIRGVLDDCEGNCVITINRDSRNSSALNCSLDDKKIKEIYQGGLRDPLDPELIGIYKITQRDTLRYWKRNCLEHRNLLIGQNFPLYKGIDLLAINGNGFDITIIKTPLDFINYLNASRQIVNNNQRGLL